MEQCYLLLLPVLSFIILHFCITFLAGTQRRKTEKENYVLNVFQTLIGFIMILFIPIILYFLSQVIGGVTSWLSVYLLGAFVIFIVVYIFVVYLREMKGRA
ncbi:hypothetical protein ACNRWW_06665 [Metabacillus sp. HB246100]